MNKLHSSMLNRTCCYYTTSKNCKRRVAVFPFIGHSGQLQMVLVVLGPLELSNKSWQNSCASVSQLMEAVKSVKQQLLSSSRDESFRCLFEATFQSSAELDLEPIVWQLQRKPPKLFTRSAAATHHRRPDLWNRRCTPPPLLTTNNALLNRVRRMTVSEKLVNCFTQSNL